MTAESKDAIINAINEYILNTKCKKSDWYVGITSNPEHRLFSEHNVNKNNGQWIYKKATSDSVARAIEKEYINAGCDGGDGGGGSDSVYIYAYLKLQGTNR